MKNKISINVILSIIKSIASIIFPLITFPYVSRILGVENIGKINFANSIINYFILLAGLGISTYGIRETSKKRDDKKELDKFISSLLSFNLLTAFISYILLIFFVIFTLKTKSYISLLFIYSLQIIFNTIGMEWVNVALENFTFITIRYILCQFLSLLLMFLFVHNETDYILYAILNIFALSGANLVNFYHIKKKHVIKLSLHIPYKQFLKPIFFIFVASISSTIYTNLDVTMLGYLQNDYSVGIYSSALKVYRILKQIIIAIIFAFEPRLVFNLKNSKEKYVAMLQQLNDLVLFFVFPLIVGIICLSNKAIIIFAGQEFLEASPILIVLSFSIFFNTLAYFFIHAILIPKGEDSKIGIPSMLGAITNIILNLLFIPKYSILGAAIATLFTEIIVFIISTILTKPSKYIKLNFTFILKIVLGCTLIVITYLIISLLNNSFLTIFLTTFLSFIFYITFELICKNHIITDYYKKIIKLLNK